MTGPERQDLKTALDFLAEWRKDDKEWKRRTDERLDRLEDRNIAADALATDGDRRKNDLRWRIGLLVGIAGSIGIGLLNYFSEHPLP